MEPPKYDTFEYNGLGLQCLVCGANSVDVSDEVNDPFGDVEITEVLQCRVCDNIETREITD